MATYSVENFRQTVLNTGLARKNRFECEIAVPPQVRQATNISEPMLSLYVESAVFPELTINAETQFIWGPLIHRPKTLNYGGFMVLQFHLDQDMRIKKMFDTWMQSIVDGDQYTISYQRDYVAPMMRITQLDDQMEPVYSVRLTEAFPAGMVQLDLNHALQNATHMLQVSFRFRKWEADDSARISAQVQQTTGLFTQNNPLDRNSVVTTPAKPEQPETPKPVVGGHIYKLPPRP